MPYYHEVEVNPELIFVKSKEVVFIKEKWSIATSVNIEFIKSTTKLGRAELELIRDAYSLIAEYNNTIAHKQLMKKRVVLRPHYKPKEGGVSRTTHKLRVTRL